MDSLPLPEHAEIDMTAVATGGVPQGMEHRWGRRIRCGAPVRVTTRAGVTVTGVMRDVSMSGAFVQTPFELPLHAPVEVAVLRDCGAEVRLSGISVRRQSDGIGIEWCEAAPSAICPVLGCATPCAAAANEF
jgi:hypothetical protein